MKYTNFERKYVRTTFGFESHICLWKHKNETVCEIEMYWETNEVYINLENGITVSIALKGSIIKVSLHDDFRSRDLSTHPCWEVNRELIVKIYLTQILRNRTTYDHREAIWDVISNEFTF